MRSNVLCLGLVATLLVLSACASEPTPEATPEAAPDAAADMPSETAADDPLSGTWTGDWGPSAEHRNQVTLELSWDGTNLTGTFNPGDNAIPLTEGSFDPQSGMVTMQTETQNFRGDTVQYMIEGQVEGNTMTGTWSHDGTEGDFTLTKQ